MTLRAEIQEVVDKYQDARADGVFTPEEIHGLARDVFDVIHVMLRLNESAISRDELSDEIENALSQIVDAKFSGRPIVRSIAHSFVSQAADQIVDIVADYSGTAQEFWAEKIEPYAARWEETIHRLRSIEA